MQLFQKSVLHKYLKIQDPNSEAKTDREIDHMVYELYGLSEEEIKIVEGT